MRNKKFLAGVIIVLGILAIGSWYWVVPKIFPFISSEKPMVIDPLEAAAKLGGQWLLKYQQPIKDPGVLWAMKEANDEYCRLPEVESQIKARFNEFASDPVQKFYLRLLDRTANQNIEEGRLQDRQAFYDDMLLPALYCNVSAVSEETKNRIFDIATSSGYELNHHFLAMVFLKNNGCADGRLDGSLKAASQKMLDEQGKASYFSDLFAERAAFLLYAGYQNQVPKDWLETIMKNQSPSGGWHDLVYFGKIDNAHTTALAVWALSQYTKACAFKL